MSDLVLPVPQTTFKNLMGMRFSHLVVAGYAGMSKSIRPRHLWRCRCDCGKDCIKSTQALRASASKNHNCGCVTRSQRIAARKTHGLSHTREFRAWAAAKSRCNNPKSAWYQIYGGRGICICERWKLFENFYADMGPMPDWANSMDRIDSNGNYEPDNCRWANPVMQSQNTSRNVFVVFNGESMCLREFGRRAQIPDGTVYNWHSRGFTPLEMIARKESNATKNHKQTSVG